MTDAELEAVIVTFLRHLELPIGRAQGFIGLTREALGTDDAALSLAYTERAVQQVFALMRSLQRYLQARDLPMFMQRVNLELAWRDVLTAVTPLMTNRRVEVTNDPLPIVRGDHTVLRMLLAEYLSNALKFTRAREPAVLHLVVRETETAYHLGLRDNGVGLTFRQQGALFQLFGRQHPAQFEGVGVGLAVVRRLMSRVGGRAWCEGVPEEGSTFWFAWPKQPISDTV